MQEKDIRKKRKTIIIEILVLLWLGILITDMFRSFFNKKPLIVFKENTYEYSDGTVTEYISLGYKTVSYARSSKSYYKIEILFKKPEKETKTWELTYTNDECSTVEERFYEDDTNYYNLICQPSSQIFVTYSDNTSSPLVKALANKEITIDEAIAKGLMTEKYSK